MAWLPTFSNEGPPGLQGPRGPHGTNFVWTTTKQTGTPNFSYEAVSGSVVLMDSSGWNGTGAVPTVTLFEAASAGNGGQVVACCAGWNASFSTNLTVTLQPGDLFAPGAPGGPGGSPAPVANGASVKLVSDGVSTWYWLAEVVG